MNKLFRYEGRCENDHRWISSPTESCELKLKECPTCGVLLKTFQKNELVEKMNTVIEPADYIALNGKVTQERRYYISLQDQGGKTLARSCQNYGWEDVVAEALKIKDINPKMILKLLRKKNWSVYES